jgi:glycosyltransferase involved in cell wall biosynthesis
MTKILWHSTAPWGSSSYGVLTKRTVPDLVRAGHEVVVSTWYGLQGEPQRVTVRARGAGKDEKPAGTFMVLPSLSIDKYGLDTLLSAYKATEADVCITCMDVWVLPVDITRQMVFCPWLPIDHDPAPAPILEALQTAVYPMVYSQWGVDVLDAAGVEAHYVPCSANAAFWSPVAGARAKLQLPDQDIFMVTMVAANKDSGDRKGFNEALQGFAKFLEHHDDARLYCHTNWGGAINIEHMADRLGIKPYMIIPDQLSLLMGMFNEDYMRTIYSASDVLLNPCKGEGFGLPILEAQLCGCPVAATDFSTTGELLAAGWKLPGVPDWSYGADSWRLRCSIDGIADALEAAYEAKGNESIRKQARKGCLKYDTETVFNRYWKPALADIERCVAGKDAIRIERMFHKREPEPEEAAQPALPAEAEAAHA